MIDAVDELIAYRKQQGKISTLLRRAYRFHKANRQVLDFLVTELQTVQANGRTRTSLGSLWHYGRWVLEEKTCIPGETFVMSNNLFPWYGRIICILHPSLNGLFEMCKCKADADLGTELESARPERGHARRLRWAGGVPLECGWQPATPHMPKPVRRRAPVRRNMAA